MPLYSFDQAPKEVQDYLNRTKQEGTSLMDVCKELDRFGVGNAEKVLLISDRLGVPFSEAKELVSKIEYQSSVAWGEEMNCAIVVTGDFGKKKIEEIAIEILDEYGESKKITEEGAI